MKNLIEQPLFVVGLAKSGTSLVCQILNNHPDFMLDFEIPLVAPFVRTYQRTLDPATRVNAFVEQTRYDDLCRERYDTLIKNGEYRSMIRQLIGGMHSGWHKGKRWGTTNKELVHFHETLQQLFPDITFLLVLRDPRDVWCSIQAWIPSHVWPSDLTRQPWKNSISLFIERSNLILNVFSAIKGVRKHIVKYEDIIENPNILFHKINVIPPANPIAGVGKVYKSRHLPSPLLSSSFPDQLLNQCGRWHQELDKKTADLIVTGCKVFKAGYYTP